MKHLLNNLSEEEKQSILEQHNGGMKVFSENFKRLVGHKSGSILNEQPTSSTPNTGGGGTVSQKPAVGGRETIKVDQTVQKFIYDPNKPENRGAYVESIHIKTVETQGSFLKVTYDSPTHGFTNMKQEYDCRKKCFASDDGVPMYLFGPETQKKFDEFCTKSMGVASTQKTSGASGIA